MKVSTIMNKKIIFFTLLLDNVSDSINKAL